jgi:hypothetical protein
LVYYLVWKLLVCKFTIELSIGKTELNNTLEEQHMKKLSLALFCVLLIMILSSFSNSKKVGTLYYEDGTIKYQGELNTDGFPHGRGKAYDSEGRLFYEGNFSNGEVDQNGYTKNYWKNGNLMFDGILKDGQRLEGHVYKEDGTYHGYLAYPPISILGAWVVGDIANGTDTVYILEFLENGKMKSPDNKAFNGTYDFKYLDAEDSNPELIIDVKGEKGFSGGQIQFNTKNNFLLTNKLGDALLFIREETDGYTESHILNVNTTKESIDLNATSSTVEGEKANPELATFIKEAEVALTKIIHSTDTSKIREKGGYSIAPIINPSFDTVDKISKFLGQYWSEDIVRKLIKNMQIQVIDGTLYCLFGEGGFMIENVLTLSSSNKNVTKVRAIINQMGTHNYIDYELKEDKGVAKIYLREPNTPTMFDHFYE